MATHSSILAGKIRGTWQEFHGQGSLAGYRLGVTELDMVEHTQHITTDTRELSKRTL